MKKKQLARVSLVMAIVLALGALVTFGSKTLADQEAVLNTEELFTERDLCQTANLEEAVYYTLADGEEIVLETEGVYVFSGEAENAFIRVNAGTEDKVQIVLDGLTVVNESEPCIQVIAGDKVFVTTTESENCLTVSGEFASSADAVIYSSEDVILNGNGSLTLISSKNGVASENDLKITGGEYTLTCEDAAFEAEDSICVADGTITVVNAVDGFHAENSGDNTLGYVYIADGTIHMVCEDDAIHGNSIVQIDGGEIVVDAWEAIEGTYIRINGGDFDFTVGDDGINAGNKSSAYTATIEINDGHLVINVLSAESDGIDANGDILLNGGTIEITAESAFDYDGSLVYNSGTVYVNGEQLYPS